jgi:8-oxo-dGTP diphosphatase
MLKCLLLKHMKERHKLIPASYLVLKKENKILMLRRFNTGYKDGFYSFPAGHVEEGESFEECLIREAKEEIGVEIRRESLKELYIIHRYKDEVLLNNARIDVFYIVENWTGEIQNLEPNKCDDLSWFDLENLPENTIPYIRVAIENIKNKVHFLEI